MHDVEYHLEGQDGDILVVHVPAHLDHSTADELTASVLHALPRRDGAGVVLDFSDVALVTSIGIAAMLQIREACADQSAALLLAGVPEQQMRFFEMLHLNSKFTCVPTVADAIFQLDGPA